MHEYFSEVSWKFVSSRQGNTFFNLNNPQEKDNFAWNWNTEVGCDEAQPMKRSVR